MTDPTRARRGMPARLGSALLTLAAIGGAICLVLVLLAVVFHITIVLFKTGSMSPTIPQGSLALVREIPADEVKVGEVVTVSRPGELPISHRVTSVRPDGTGSARIITLRGDANPVDDPLPYTVQSVRLVVWSAPGLAYVVVWFSNPIVLGIVALGVGALVTWAFWPAAGDSRPRRGRRSIKRYPTTVVLLLLAGAASSWMVVPQSARAAQVEQVTQGSVIRLVSIGDALEMADLTPGIPTLWQVGVSANAPEPGTITLSLAAGGPLAESPAGLTVGAEGCDVRWVGNTCASGQRTLIAPQPAVALGGAAQALGTITTADQRWILVSALVPDAASVRAGTAEVRITATGMGDSQSAGSGNSHGGSGSGDGSSGNWSGSSDGFLAATGTNLARPLLFALGSLLAGLGFAGAASIARRRGAPEEPA
ncbi:MAG: hypothetical protein JWQ12_2387 [Glaciihabitans sp.]|nr:hypothetical protein [Glaciihabitans sp.]